MRFFLMMLVLVYSCSGPEVDEKVNRDKKSIKTINNSLTSLVINTSKNEILITNDREWILDSELSISSGKKVIIEEGTVIKAAEISDKIVPTLIIEQGAKIIAQGSFDNPIIFTSVLEDENKIPENHEKGLWGGIIILGYSHNNGEQEILSSIFKEYGGIDEKDNSGVLNYVSLRYAGASLDGLKKSSALTLAGVGKGTNINNLEVIGSEGDGIKFLGGNSNLKNIIIGHCKDDCLELNNGYSGKIQFLLAYQDSSCGGRIIENNGFKTEKEERFKLGFEIQNATMIGRGLESNKRLISFKNGAEGKLRNNLFYNQKKGIDLERSYDDKDCFTLLTKSRISISHNVFYHIHSEKEEVDVSQLIKTRKSKKKDKKGDKVFLLNYFKINENIMDDLGIKQYPIQIIPTKLHGHTTYQNLDGWFENVKYFGAFSPNQNSNWAKWSILFKNIKEAKTPV